MRSALMGVRLAAAVGAVLVACSAPPPLVTPPPSPGSSVTPSPTREPTVAPSLEPTLQPTIDPTIGPSPSPSVPSPSLPVPSPSVAPSPSGLTGTFLEVLRDDLSDPRSGFPTVDDPTQRVVYEEDTLRLDLRMAGRATWSARGIGDWPLADVAGSMARVDDTGEGFYGLTCGIDSDTYYAGLVGTDGSALLLRVDDGVATRLAQQLAAVTPPTAGVPLSLGLSCFGGDSGGTPGIVLTLAGRVVASAIDQDGFASFRRAGFYAEAAPDSESFSVRGDDFAVTVGLVADPDSGPSPSPSLTGDPLADALAEHVPEAFRAACRKVDRFPFEEVVAVDCPSGDVVSAVYLQYATVDAMEADYDGLVDAHPEADGPDCALGPGEGPYTVDGASVGRLLCYDSVGAAWFAWTDERLRIMGHAHRNDDSFDALYDWWLVAGPVP